MEELTKVQLTLKKYLGVSYLLLLSFKGEKMILA